MCINQRTVSLMRQAGLSLVEVIIFIVIIGVGVTALVQTMSSMSRNSVDPLLQKQALAVAESLLEEIMLQPFTVCDPNDPNNLNPAFVPAVNGANCTGGDGGINDVGHLPLGSQATAAGKTRDGLGPGGPFNNVSDYAILAPSTAPMVGIRDINGAAIAQLAGYTAIISITEAGAVFGLNSAEALKIEVTVRTPKFQDNLLVPEAEDELVTLTGYRLRYAPVAPP